MDEAERRKLAEWVTRRYVARHGALPGPTRGARPDLVLIDDIPARSDEQIARERDELKRWPIAHGGQP